MACSLVFPMSKSSKENVGTAMFYKYTAAKESVCLPIFFSGLLFCHFNIRDNWSKYSKGSF